MQIVQPSGSMLPNQASAGVGAVIFDKPQYDPLTVQMRVNAELDDFAKQKQAQAEKQKADTAKLVADLNFDAKGIYDQDNDFFIDGKRKLIDANAKLYSLEPNTQAFRDAEKEAKRLQGFYSVEAQASAMHKDMLANAIKDFDPTKHDKKYFDEWIVGMRTAASIEERNKVAGKNPFMPIQKTLEEKTLRLFDEAQKAGLVKPIAVKQEYGRTPDGEGILIEKEEILPENKSLDLAQGWLANSDIKNDVLEQYSQLPESEQSYYLNRAKELSQKYSTKDQAKVYDPISVYYSQSTLDKYNVGSQKRTQLGFSPKQQQEAEFMYSAGEQDAKKVGESLVKLVSGIMQGKPEYLKPARLEYGGRQVNAVRAQGLNGFKLGTYEYFNDKSGQRQILPNEIKDVIRMPDGRVMVMTSQSYDKEYQRTEGDESKMQIASLYIPYTSATQLYNDVVTGNYKGQNEQKYRTSGMDWVKDNFPDAYLGATGFDASKVAPLSQEEQEQRDAIYGLKVVRREEALPKEVGIGQIFKPQATPQPKNEEPKKQGKTVSLQTIKSKVGTKGFEGYTEKELVDYYTSQGYKIQ
jgi:hypothetical protein